MNAIQIVKGMTSMKNPNPIYLTKEVKKFVTNLINDYDYISYRMLSHSDKCEFIAHLIQASGKDGEREFLTESNHLDQTIYYFTKALLGTCEDDENFLFIIKDNAIKYFEETMECIFEYLIESNDTDKNSWIDHVTKYGDPDEAYQRYQEGLS